MNYKKIKRSKIDKCNICGEVTNLTWDHVPPKNCFNDTKIVCNRLFDPEALRISRKYKIFQSGIRYRTICGNCNNGLLGAIYDTELKKFIDVIDKMFNSKIILDGIYNTTFNANKISRSIVGHLLSAKAEYDGETLIDEKLRTFFLNQSNIPPDNLKLLYYIYPYESMLILRDIVVEELAELPSGLISCLLFYPIAFILCDGVRNCSLTDMFSLCSKNIDDETNIPINFNSCRHSNGRLRHFLWPCNISNKDDGTSFILGGKHFVDSVYAPKREIKR